MTIHLYEPPQRQFTDAFLSFIDYRNAGTWAALVESDPLGPVNKIVSLMRGQRRVKSVLCPVPAGADVRVVRDERGWTIDEVLALQNTRWLMDDNIGTLPDPREPGWRIEINGRTVLSVTDAEMRTPYTPPPPPPLWHRMRTALREQLRADVDAVAKRLGFHRADECGGWDE